MTIARELGSTSCKTNPKQLALYKLSLPLWKTGKHIKHLRSDNGLEFLGDPCSEFLTSKGISQQTSCNDRPQENGVVERKHRHLLEISRALRFQSGLPLTFWGDCVLAAAHIINRLPNSAIKNQIPFEVLFHRTPDCQPLKAFGCLAFAYTHHRNKDKFKPRGIPCVFIGDPSHQKGYKLLDLISHRTFVPRDVQFHETVFPLHTSFKDSKLLHPVPNEVPALHQHVSYDDILPALSSRTTPPQSPNPHVSPIRSPTSNHHPNPVIQPPPMSTHLHMLP